MKPTLDQLNDPKWWNENQPVGYPVWIKDLSPTLKCDGSGWHRDNGDRYVDRDGKYWKKCDDNLYLVYEYPDCKPWAGPQDGAPPVGTLITVDSDGYILRDGDDVFIGVPLKVAAIFKMEDGTEMMAVDGGKDVGCGVFRVECARPASTLEQIVAKERDLTFGDMKWFAAQPKYANVWWVISNDPEGFERVDETCVGGFTEEIAHLIASSPDFYTHAVNLIESVKRKYNITEEELTCEHMRGLASAISKARGFK